MRHGVPYIGDEIPYILPKFRKDVSGGGWIFIVERDALGADELSISPTTTDGGGLTERTISTDRRILLGVRYVNLFAPNIDYRRPEFAKI